MNHSLLVVVIASGIAYGTPLLFASVDQRWLVDAPLGDNESAVMVDNAQMDDAHEGMNAFLEKRPPDWNPK